MKAVSLSMRAGLPLYAPVALVALVAFHGAARADVAPPELNGCARRPEGAVCYVKGVERGVCVKRPGEPRECLVIADPKDAPPPPSTPDPPPNAEADAAPPSRWACAARAPTEGDSSEVAILAAFVVMALAAARRARSSPAR